MCVWINNDQFFMKDLPPWDNFWQWWLGYSSGNNGTSLGWINAKNYWATEANRATHQRVDTLFIHFLVVVVVGMLVAFSSWIKHFSIKLAFRMPLACACLHLVVWGSIVVKTHFVCLASIRKRDNEWTGNSNKANVKLEGKGRSENNNYLVGIPAAAPAAIPASV